MTEREPDAEAKIQHTARCACGQLSLTVEGGPEFVALCSCLQCQRRTGAPFGVSAYFLDAQVAARAGESTTWRRISQRGRWFEQHFCPTCGTTLFWIAEFLPGKVGVAAGTFGDPSFPAPTIAVWDTTRHPWVAIPGDWRVLDEQRF